MIRIQRTGVLAAGLVAACGSASSSGGPDMMERETAMGSTDDGDSSGDADEQGMSSGDGSSGDSSSDRGDPGACDLDPSRLDRSADGYPSGPYGTLPGDRLAPAVGSTLSDCAGVPGDFRELFGECNRAVLVSIHAGWSGPGRADREALSTVQAEYREVGVEIVHVLIEDVAGGLPTADFCTSWLNGSPDEGLEPVDPAPIVFIDAAGGWRGSYVEQPTAQLPMHFLLDANANIRLKTVGSALPPNELRTQLDRLRAAPYEPAE